MPQGSYGAALVEYFHAYRQRPREPLTLLSIAAALLNQVMSKKVPDRDRAVVTVFAFLQVWGPQLCLLCWVFPFLVPGCSHLPPEHRACSCWADGSL